MIERFCYGEANRYFHWCGVDAGTVHAFRTADSMGSHFNRNIKGHCNCRKGYVPAYE